MSEYYTIQADVDYWTGVKYRTVLEYLSEAGYLDEDGRITREDGTTTVVVNNKNYRLAIPHGYYRNLGRLMVRDNVVFTGVKTCEVCWTTTDGQFSGYYYRKNSDGSFVEVYEEDLWQWSLDAGVGIENPETVDEKYLEAQAEIEKAWNNYHIS